MPVPPPKRHLWVSEPVMRAVDTAHADVVVVARRQGGPVPSPEAFVEALIRAGLASLSSHERRLVVTPAEALSGVR